MSEHESIRDGLARMFDPEAFDTAPWPDGPGAQSNALEVRRDAASRSADAALAYLAAQATEAGVAEVLRRHRPDPSATGITPGGNPVCICGRWYVDLAGVDERRAARRLSFIAGAEWQHTQDAETIEALRAEVEHQKRLSALRSDGLSDALEQVATLRAKVAAVDALAARWVALAEAQGSAYKALFADTLRGNAGALRAALADPEVPRD